jgi:DNA-directed RNA polymerase subunit RPC12/RpoP
MPLMSIYFKCKSCGKTLKIIDENKFGVRTRCPECRNVMRIPGIAMQDQASSAQIERMHTAVNQHRRALWVFFVLLTVFILASGLRSFVEVHPFLNWLVFFVGLLFLFSEFLLLDRMSTSRKYLGGSIVTSILLFVVLMPIWVILCVTSYFRIRTRLITLKEAGTRNDDV